MFNTIYSWFRDNSVDLDLVCSSLPEFKDTPWTIYEEFSYFYDDYITDIAEEVEGIVTNNDKFLINTIYEALQKTVARWIQKMLTSWEAWCSLVKRRYVVFVEPLAAADVRGVEKK